MHMHVDGSWCVALLTEPVCWRATRDHGIICTVCFYLHLRTPVVVSVVVVLVSFHPPPPSSPLHTHSLNCLLSCALNRQLRSIHAARIPPTSGPLPTLITSIQSCAGTSRTSSRWTFAAHCVQTSSRPMLNVRMLSSCARWVVLHVPHLS